MYLAVLTSLCCWIGDRSPVVNFIYLCRIGIPSLSMLFKDQLRISLALLGVTLDHVLIVHMQTFSCGMKGRDTVHGQLK